jgi:hypothetical protein
MRLPPLVAAVVAGGVLLHAAGDAQARKPPRGGDDQAQTQDQGPLLQPNSYVSSPPQRPSISPDAAARVIQNRHGGRVLAVQQDGSGYRVKVLKDGEVRIFQVNQ